MMKNLKNIICLIIILLLAVSSLFLFIDNKKKNDNINSLNQRIKELEKEIKKISTDNGDLTKDWKTYRNEEFEFEIKYPTDFEFGKPKNYLSRNEIVLGYLPVFRILKEFSRKRFGFG